mmetsp:Transcript_27675/g.48190  ORF Transcript_27675/g.48190 Transcript_27675/m.48190 type:complete len:87 (-) Transcript_27675:195-455(-)
MGSATKLLWECSEGHQFWQTPNNVRRKVNAPWCRECKKQQRAAAGTTTTKTHRTCGAAARQPRQIDVTCDASVSKVIWKGIEAWPA